MAPAPVMSVNKTCKSPEDVDDGGRPRRLDRTSFLERNNAVRERVKTERRKPNVAPKINDDQSHAKEKPTPKLATKNASRALIINPAITRPDRAPKTEAGAERITPSIRIIQPISFEEPPIALKIPQSLFLSSAEMTCKLMISIAPAAIMNVPKVKKRIENESPAPSIDSTASRLT